MRSRKMVASSGERVRRISPALPGCPAQATSVERKVYAPGGKLLYDDVFHSTYRAEPGLVRVGTKKLDKSKSKPPTSTTPLVPPLQ